MDPSSDGMLEDVLQSCQRTVHSGKPRQTNMTISQRIQQQLFTSSSPDQGELIRLPPTLLAQETPAVTARTSAGMATTTRRTSQTIAEQSGTALEVHATSRPRPRRTNLWTIEEHERFLHGLEMYRHGPWKHVAAVVGTKTTRQTMTHAQKYRQKIERRQRVHEAMASVAASYPGVATARSLVLPRTGTYTATTTLTSDRYDEPCTHTMPRQLGGFFHSGDISPSAVIPQRHDGEVASNGHRAEPYPPQPWTCDPR